ncbi:MAG: SDR family oxidoreductase [Verrucomicrobia bacterium]|nr:SDR family oxidoreductase [Verrucomicrobiota bacterium]
MVALRRILVTGASGLLGSQFVLAARERGFEVDAAYRTWAFCPPGVRGIQCDIQDEADCLRLIELSRPDAVVHCAAWTDVDGCEGQPARALHFNGVVPGLLAAAAKRSARLFVYISTDSVFDGRLGGYSEQAVPNPINVYARTKLYGERSVQSEWNDALVIRTNIVGWNAQPKKSLVEWILSKLIDGQIVPGFKDVFFNPLEAGTLARILLDLIEIRGRGLFHLGASDSCSKLQLAQYIAEIFDQDAKNVSAILSSSVELRAARPLNTTLHVSRVEALLGRGMPTIRDGLHEMLRQDRSGERIMLVSLVNRVMQ